MSEAHQSTLSLHKDEFAQETLGTREPWGKKKKGKKKKKESQLYTST